MLFLLSALELHRLGPARAFVPEPYSSASVIRFSSGDSAILASDISHLTSDIVSCRYVLVHLPSPVAQSDLARLRSDGLDPVGYIAYQNIICRKTAGRQPLTAGRLVVLPFLPEYKLSPELRRSPATSPRPLVLSFWPGEEPQAVAAELTASGARVIETGPRTVTAVAEPLAAARLDAVAWVQHAGRFEPFNDNCQWLLQSGWHATVPGPQTARPVWSRGIRGQDITVGLFDTGINTSHVMFLDPFEPITRPGLFPGHRKIPAYKLYPGAVFGDAGLLGFHGSAVAGTLAGSDTGFPTRSPLDGMAPDARIYFLDVASTGNYVVGDDLTEALDSVRLSRGMPEPVRQVSGSFGSMDGLSYYRLPEATLDAVCWADKDFLVVWASGNGGGPRYRLGHPACAKNALTVGGSGNGTAGNEVYVASSRGPTRDGRIKPNVLAPAENVRTVDGGDSTSFDTLSGTSFSAPAASGALCLVRQYFRDGWYPTGMPEQQNRVERVSSALFRALAITSADSNCGPLTTPNDDAGWGRLDLSAILHFAGDSLELRVVDERDGLSTGQFHEYEFRLDRRTPLTVTLAWTDTAASPEADIALVNDLDLDLLGPDNNRYRGNQFNGGQSAPNPIVWDEKNVEEVCRLYLPLAGTWHINVYGRSIYTVKQPYALVIRAGAAGTAVSESKAQHAPAGTPTLFSSAAAPARLMLRPGELLRLFAVDGREVCRSRGPEWRAAGLRSGVYCWTAVSPAGPVRSGRLIVGR